MIPRAASAIAVRPEPHFRSSVNAGTLVGSPAAKIVLRATL